MLQYKEWILAYLSALNNIRSYNNLVLVFSNIRQNLLFSQKGNGESTFVQFLEKNISKKKSGKGKFILFICNCFHCTNTNLQIVPTKMYILCLPVSISCTYQYFYFVPTSMYKQHFSNSIFCTYMFHLKLLVNHKDSEYE